jgi:hypothetical protein
MKRIFITGDRSMPAFHAAGLVNAVIEDLVRQTGGDLAIGTGSCANGIERAVRFLVPDHAMNLAHYEMSEEGEINFESVFRELRDITDQVVFIHMDPLASHIGQALAKVFPEDMITMPLQEVMAGL